MSQRIFRMTSLVLSRDCLLSFFGLALERARRVDVILGMPRHNCRFHGICKIEEHSISPLPTPDVCNNKVAGWLLRPGVSYCILLIEKGTLNASFEAYHFARRKIEVSQPVDVTPFYNEKGGRKFFLRGGKYPLRTTKDFYVLSLPLTNHTQTSSQIKPYHYE